MRNNKEINILILSSYNNVELVKAFMRAKEELGINGKVITSDMNKNVPSSFISDKHVYIGHISKEESKEDIIRICNEENISLIIPLMDKQLKPLSKYKDEIEKNTNAKIMISNEEVIDICLDKHITYKFLVENKLDTPKIIKEEDLKNENYQFPLYIKPFNGGGSIDNYKLTTKKELDFFYEYIENPIVQEFISGEEYCVDIFVDFEGNPITIVPKQRLKALAGRILEGKIEKNRLIIEKMKELVNKLKPNGEINVDCMLVDDKVYILEVNTRMAAGGIFSYKAGANTPKNIYRLLNEEKLVYSEDYIDNLTCIKYDKFVLNDGDKIIDGI